MIAHRNCIPICWTKNRNKFIYDGKALIQVTILQTETDINGNKYPKVIENAFFQIKQVV